MHGIIILIIILFALLIIGIPLLGTLFWIWMLIDCLTNKRLKDTQKAIWAFVIVFTHFIGALIYFFAGRLPQKIQPPPVYYPSPYPQPQPRPQSQEQAQQHYQPYESGYRAHVGARFIAPGKAQFIAPNTPARPRQESQHLPPQTDHPGRESETRYEHSQYEQPQVSYPENP